MRKNVSIILPVYNEKDNLKKTVYSVLKLQKSLLNYKIDIVISDSCSNDGTSEIAENLSKKFSNIHYINVGPGLGVGLHDGHGYAIKKLKPHVLVQMDADGQVDEEIIPRLIYEIEKGYDLVLGSRFVTGGRNELAFTRKCFTFGSSVFCRLVMGPLKVQEYTNSARAFTPKLFKKINWKRLPWRRKTFIYMPAFLNEAILAGAKYKEVPLIFKNRSMGYSKNKIINYTLDIIVYSFEARLNKWGLNNSLFNTVRGGNGLK